MGFSTLATVGRPSEELVRSELSGNLSRSETMIDEKIGAIHYVLCVVVFCTKFLHPLTVYQEKPERLVAAPIRTSRAEAPM